MKSTVIVPIRDQGQGWQWRSTGILVARSLSFCRASTSDLPEWSWSKAEESSSFCCALTSQLLDWLEQAQCPSWVRTTVLGTRPWRSFWGPDCFSGVFITGSSCFFHSGVVDPRDKTYNLSAVGVARITAWGRVQTGWTVVVFFF